MGLILQISKEKRPKRQRLQVADSQARQVRFREQQTGTHSPSNLKLSRTRARDWPQHVAFSETQGYFEVITVLYGGIMAQVDATNDAGSNDD